MAEVQQLRLTDAGRWSPDPAFSEVDSRTVKGWSYLVPEQRTDDGRPVHRLELVGGQRLFVAFSASGPPLMEHLGVQAPKLDAFPIGEVLRNDGAEAPPLDGELPPRPL